ncbi:DsrE family protein [Actinoplanes sp. G11-F43]|uniref:DsrE family protein n=1 Tax=Actinoplanes sp. G11-F43 TaxID=3424130 RepID=UPI003D358774
MLAGMARLLVVKATAGADAPERCNQAFNVASTAATAGIDVSFWLTGESTWFALPGRAAEFTLAHAAPLPDLIELLLEAGRITACTQCAARRDIGPGDVLPGIRIAGAAVFVEEIMSDNAQALVY